MYGLGKLRTKLGKYIDRHGITQEDLRKSSGLSRDSISNLCDGTKRIKPGVMTMRKIIGALRRRGHDVRPDDFWDI